MAEDPPHRLREKTIKDSSNTLGGYKAFWGARRYFWNGVLIMLSLLFLSVAWVVQNAVSVPSTGTLRSDMTLLFQNDLNWQTAPDHNGTILLSSLVTHAEALRACGGISESLLPTSGLYFQDDIKTLLRYVTSNEFHNGPPRFWISTAENSSSCRAISATGVIQEVRCNSRLQALCSQSAPYRRNTATDPNTDFQIEVNSKQLTVLGTRDRLAFRFLGIPYANPFERFSYSEVYNGSGTISALNYGPACSQRSSGSEDCLTLNIQTPYLPQNGDKLNKLKAVMFWIHGGGFTDGVSSDSVFDGGSLASRGDVVVVSINYRLGTLGFLALEDGITNGNFGIADQITALQWVKAHIRDFGGDPNRATIFGQSAGAGSVRALLAAKPAFGLFKGAIAQSNLGGFGYAETYSKYMSIKHQYTSYAQSVISAVGCSESDDILKCLRGVPAQALLSAPGAPRYIVVDGKYITTDELRLDGSGPTANAHVMFGWTRDDGSDFIGAWPKADTTSLEILTRAGLNAEIAAEALNSGLFPLPSGANATWNVFNQTSRIATAGQFLCIDQATVIAAAKHKVFLSIYAYQFDRTYVGWEPIAATCGPSKTPEFPQGDMRLPYFRCHSGELAYMFGTLGQDSLPFRDWDDLVMAQVSVDTWTSFARTYDPNPSPAFLVARGYTNTTLALKKGGRWGALTPTSKTPLRRIDSPFSNSVWVEKAQCAILGYPLDFYG